MKHLLDNGYEVQFRDMYNNSIITEARDLFTHIFLKSGCDYLFFIDADQSFKPEDVLKMIEEDKDIIGGVVPKKRMNWESIQQAALHGVPYEVLSKFSGEFNLALLPEQEQPEDFSKSFEVSHIGTGMMIIKRSVFEKLKGHTRKYTYTGTGILGVNPGDNMNEYWNTNISDEGIMMGEDVNFCYMWRKLGGKVYAAPYAKTTHIGSYEFSGTLNP
jgi:GT2 family glycosyltransferase